MRAVQRSPAPGWRAVGRVALTVLAALLVLLVLIAPEGVADVRPATFLRLPLEPLVLLAVVLVLPPRLDRLRVLLAVTSGLLLGLAAILRLLDLGFLAVLNRPFDPLIDWRYAGSLVETVRSSVGGSRGTLLLALVVLCAVTLLVLVPLAVLRLSGVASRHRAGAAAVLAGLAAVWGVLAVQDVRGDAGTIAIRNTATYMYGQFSRIPAEVRDMREFAEAAESDPLRDVPADELLTGLRGKDVLFVFVESYGRVALEGPSATSGVDAALASGDEQLREAGFASRSAFLTSPTFGALSWLAHATLQSGLWVDSQQRYDVLVTSERLTLSHLFARAGWRTVIDSPANTREWPQGAFYDADQLYDSRNVGYEGPRFGYPTMPDQYTLDAFHRLELANGPREPVMAEIDLVTSHAPWSRTPRMIEQEAVGDGSVYDGMPEQLPSETDIWTSPERVRRAYADAIEYSLASLVTFVTTYGDDDLVVVMLGDHQPATIVSGEDAGHDVPVAILARDRLVLEAISSWAWDDGLHPAPEAPVWRMDTFRDRFVAAFGPGEETGTREPR